jgi:hypothetical protein
MNFFLGWAWILDASQGRDVSATRWRTGTAGVGQVDHVWPWLLSTIRHRLFRGDI